MGVLILQTSPTNDPVSSYADEVFQFLKLGDSYCDSGGVFLSWASDDYDYLQSIFWYYGDDEIV